MERTPHASGPVHDTSERAGTREDLDACTAPPRSRHWSASGATHFTIPQPPTNDVPRRRGRGVVGACTALLLAATTVAIAAMPSGDGSAVTTTSVAAAPESVTMDPVAVPEYSARVVRTGRGTTATAAIGLNSVRSRGVYFVVDVKLTNNGATPATLTYARQRLNAYGSTFPADRTATSYLNVSPSMTITPTGHPVGVKLAFDIPADYRPHSITLELDDRNHSSVELPLS